MQVGTPIQVRQANASDVEAVVTLNTALFAEDAASRDPDLDQTWPKREGRAYFAGVLTDPHSVCYLATHDDTPVGYLVARIRPPSPLRPVTLAELESMYVRERYRSQGLGARLVEQFLAWASANHAHRATVTAYAANQRAISFYQRVGFQPKRLSLEMGI
jgi:ribosomal protein S18 acetylase RimI-like enzyme